MSNKKSTHASADIASSVLDDVRQFCYPAEFRIDSPDPVTAGAESHGKDAQPVVAAEGSAGTASSTGISNKLVAELASCLWYLKTKYFKHAWSSDGVDDDEPRVRRALARLNKAVEAMADYGIEVHDPTNERYPAGGEGMMKPIQFLPTVGITVEVVTETVSPIIYRNERLIMRGEVFVAVPKGNEVSGDGSPSEAGEDDDGRASPVS